MFPRRYFIRWSRRRSVQLFPLRVSNRLLTRRCQRQTKALDDRLSEPYGVRTEGWIRLTACHPNRVQASVRRGAIITVLGGVPPPINQVKFGRSPSKLIPGRRAWIGSTMPPRPSINAPAGFLLARCGPLQPPS
jgi:hypothetical protein